MKRLALVFCALSVLAAPADAGRRFNRNPYQVPRYIQTHTAPYSQRVAVIYPHEFLTGLGADGGTSKTNLLKSFNTRLGTLFSQLRDLGAEVHFYDSNEVMDSTAAGTDAAGEQAQPIWNNWGTEYPVTLMVGFRSQYDGTLADRRPFFKAYSTTTQMIHLVFNTSASLYDDAGTAANQNCGTGALSFSLQTPLESTRSRVCTYGGNRDTIYGNSLTYVTRVPDSTRNADIHSIVRLFKPVPGSFFVGGGSTGGVVPSEDDSVALQHEVLPVAYRVYWKVPGTSTKGRNVDYVLLGSITDNEGINWQHIAAALVLRYTRIPALPVGWVDLDDNGNWGMNKVHGSPNSIRRESWPSAALLDSIVDRGASRWGVVWNMNGPIDSMLYYRDQRGYSYMNRARYISQHAHDTVATHVYGNVFGKANNNADTSYSGVHSHRWSLKYDSGFESDRHAAAGTRDLGMYWRLRDHANRVRANFPSASGTGYLNVPGADCLPMDWRAWNVSPMTPNYIGHGYAPPDSFFLAWSRAGIHTLAVGFESDYQPDTVYGGGYAHSTARVYGNGIPGGAIPRKYFAFGNESTTLASGTDPEGRNVITGEDRTIRNALWLSVSEVTPQADSLRANNSTKFVNSMLGLRRTTWIRPNVRYNVGETSIPSAGGFQLQRGRNTDVIGRVATTGLHGRYFVPAGASNSYGDWHSLQTILNHFSAMNEIAGRVAYRFVEPWKTFPGRGQ